MLQLIGILKIKCNVLVLIQQFGNTGLTHAVTRKIFGFFANCLQVLIIIQSASFKRQMIDWINSVTRVINRIKQFSFYTFRVYLQKLNEAVHSFGLHFGSLRQSRGEKAKNCKLTESDGECIGNSVVYSIWTSVFHEMQTNEFENRNLKLNEC